MTADEAFPYTMFVFFFKFLGDFRTIFELCTLCSYVCVCAGIFLCGLGLWPHWIIQISCEELYCLRSLYIPGTFLSCTHCLHIPIGLNLSCVHILFGCRLLCICTLAQWPCLSFLPASHNWFSLLHSTGMFYFQRYFAIECFCSSLSVIQLVKQI